MKRFAKNAHACQRWALCALIGAAPLVATPALAAADRSAAEMGNLTREEAVQLIKSELAARKIQGSSGLNDKDLGGLTLGGQAVYFEYVASKLTLRVHALVYRFRRPPRAGVIEGFQKEERSGVDTGGGKVEYQVENSGVYLSRSYTGRVEPSQFHSDLERLARAASHWAAEVVPIVATKVSGAAH